MTHGQHGSRRTQRLGLLVAAFAFVLQNLAWSLMPAYAADVEAGWITICTSDGIKRIPLSELGVHAADASQEPAPHVLTDHCDLCVFAHGLGMPGPEASLPVVAGHMRLLRLPVASQNPGHDIHSAHQPRAPPVSALI
ncbi:MAG TPA: DUF2946 family protein [Burkholderiaceae bacterium]|nr:DUF2946 family protein [Burkholderiaceae bacterium]